MGLAAVHPLLVASRDGGLYIIDGQHRWEAAKLRGDIQFMPCAVGNYTGSAEEAALFVAANRHRVRVNPMDMWRAAVAAGDEATVALERLVTAAGCRSRSTPQHQLKPASCSAPRRSTRRSDPRRRQGRPR
jgi:ParB-like chromosome segregation protein Spo0J